MATPNEYCWIHENKGDRPEIWITKRLVKVSDSRTASFKSYHLPKLQNKRNNQTFDMIRWWKNKVWVAVFYKKTSLWYTVKEATANLDWYVLILWDENIKYEHIATIFTENTICRKQKHALWFELLILTTCSYFMHSFHKNQCISIQICCGLSYIISKTCFS